MSILRILPIAKARGCAVGIFKLLPRWRCSHKPLRKFSPAFFKRRHGSNAVGRWSSSAEDEIPISFERARKGEQVLGLAGGGNVPLRNLGGVQTKFQTDTPMGSFFGYLGTYKRNFEHPLWSLYRAEQKGEGSPLLAGAILLSVHKLTNLATELNWKAGTFPFPLSQKLTFREVFEGLGELFSKSSPKNASPFKKAPTKKRVFFIRLEFGRKAGGGRGSGHGRGRACRRR